MIPPPRNCSGPGGLAGFLTVLALLLPGWESCAVPPAAPSNFHHASSNANNQATLAWDDNSSDEAGFVLEVWNGASWFDPFGALAADETELPITGFSTGSVVSWRIRAFNAASEFSDPVELTVTMRVGSVGAPDYHQSQIGESINLQLTSPGFTSPTFELGALPEGVTFNAATSEISGITTEGGFFPILIKAIEGIDERRASIALAIIDPPQVTAPQSPQGIAGTSQDLDLNSVFDDPDTETTAVIKTNLGDIPLTLFDTAAPVTCDNFKGYMDRGDWDNTIIHRSVPGFVLQGGWLYPEIGSGKIFTTVPSQGFIADEYDDARPNAATTFAMAKNNPNQATTNWFIGLRDNAQNLDLQAGGFAAFARLIGAGRTVTSAIDALTDATYSGISINGVGGRELANMPLTEVTAESPLESQLVVVSSVERVDPMTFELVGNSHPSAVAASLDDSGMLSLGYAAVTESEAGGESTITVAATDFDGARTEYSFTAKSLVDYTGWAGVFLGGAPEDNTDGGILTDLQEYAFGGAPTASGDDSSIAPHLAEVEVAGESYDAIVFYHRKYASDLVYTVQATTDLVVWADLWTSADGNGAEAVAATEDMGAFWKRTVRPPAPRAAGGSRQFFRVVVGLVGE